MGRSPACSKKEVLKRGPWTAEEDKILTAYIEQHGHGSWRALPEKAGLKRCGKSCRLRWINYLRPDIKRGKFSLQEEQTIIQLHALLGNRWSAMAAHLPKRTDNEIKNHWNTHLKKRLIKMGIDPMTHKPRTDNPSSFSSGPGKNASNLSHMAQWESARLEAEARLVRQSSKPVGANPMILPKNQPINNVAAAASGRPRCLDVLKAWQGVVAGMFAFPSQDLESPTSTLNFSDATVRAAPVDGLTGYMDNSWKCFEKSNNQMQEVDERMITDTCIELQEDLTDSVDAGAWFGDSFRVGDENVPIADIMEGLSDALIFNSGVLNSSMGVEKSSESCWDSVFNFLNSSPYASPSPVF